MGDSKPSLQYSLAQTWFCGAYLYDIRSLDQSCDPDLFHRCRARAGQYSKRSDAPKIQ
jgi:hypothetical protein